jgi:hypothetical protein
VNRPDSAVFDISALCARYSQLCFLLNAYSSDPSKILAEGQNLCKTERSYHTLLQTRSEARVQAQLEALFARAEGDLSSIFATREEIMSELLPLLSPLRGELPYHSSNLVFSSPMGDPESTSLNIIIRLYDPGRLLTVKIKTGIFIDSAGALYWEVGFVDIHKSLQNLRRNFIINKPSRRDYFLLQRLVECAKHFIRRRIKVKGLDITPAFYHVVSLSRRLGGVPASDLDWREWNSRIEAAYHYSMDLLARHGGKQLFHELQRVKRRYVISWLFDNNMMRDPVTNGILKWSPPRLICATSANNSNL